MAKKYKKLAVVFLLGLLFLAGRAHAAQILFEGRTQNITVGEQYVLNVFLNTEGARINAIKGTLLFPEEFLRFRDVQDGNSIVNFWTEKPELRQSDGINFSGIIPGGYEGKRGFIFSVFFTAKKPGIGAMQLSEVKVLLNDGKGTPAAVILSPFELSVTEQTAFPIVLPTVPEEIPRGVPETIEIDATPPESFQAQVEQSPSIFEGQFFLVFATQDKGSGMDYYEVCEGTRSNCERTENPYLIKNQKLDEKIFVRAVDKAGNERTVIVPAQNPKPWYKNYLLDLGVLILLGIFVELLFRFRHKKSLFLDLRKQN